MSAKMRITLWITLMMLLLAALVLTFVFVVNANSITDDPAGRLVKVVQRNAAQVEFEHGKLEWDDLYSYKRGVYCIFYDKDFDVLSGAAPEGFNIHVPVEQNVVRTVEAENDSYFVYDQYVDMEIAGLWIRGIVSTSDRSGLMHTIVVLTLTLLPALIVISLGGGWIIAWSAFRPMERIVNTANEIWDTGDLTRRVGLTKGPKELHLLSRAFDRMFGKLEQSFLAERQFASDASHELRTPITVILAECDRAKRKAKTPDDFLQSIAVIEEQGAHMSELVQSLLAMTRIQHGTDKYPLRRGNISEFTLACCEEFMPEDSRGISFTADVPDNIEVKFNPSLMSRVVMNLLQNAYKYGRENGHIKLSLRDGADFVTLSVSDDGIGIAPENIHRVWQRFWQADPSRSENGSSGLGLSMVREIAHFHGGDASVESTLGEGSTFTVTLPKN